MSQSIMAGYRKKPEHLLVDEFLSVEPLWRVKRPQYLEVDFPWHQYLIVKAFPLMYFIAPKRPPKV